MTALGPGMSDRDPVTTWADIAPKPRHEPLELTRARDKTDEAHQQFYAAVDRWQANPNDDTKATMDFQGEQAKLLERQYLALYAKVGSCPECPLHWDNCAECQERGTLVQKAGENE